MYANLILEPRIKIYAKDSATKLLIIYTVLVELRTPVEVVMKQKFENLAKINKNKDLDSKVVESFTTREAKREEEYQIRAQRQSPTEQFYARSYNL